MLFIFLIIEYKLYFMYYYIKIVQKLCKNYAKIKQKYKLIYFFNKFKINFLYNKYIYKHNG